MKKKNTLPTPMILGVLILLTLIVIGTNHALKNTASSGFQTSAPKNFFQILGDILEAPFQAFFPNHGSKGNNSSNQNTTDSNQAGRANMDNQDYLDFLSGASSSSSQKTTASGISNSTENDQKFNNENTPQTYITVSNAETNSNNAENNSTYNEDRISSNSADNSVTNSSTYSSTNSTNSSGYTVTGASDSNPGKSPGNNSSSNPTNTSSSSPGSNSGNNSGNNNQNNMTTINPIPPDNTVSQSVNLQNQQQNALAAILASRKALVVPVVQQAQSLKYQSVNSQNLPVPSSNQPPSDKQQDIKSGKYMFH